LSTPALEEWFSLDVRRNRKSFMLSTIAALATFAVCYFVWLQFAETPRGKLIGLILFGFPTIICTYLLTAQRLRDFGVSGWFALLWILIGVVDDPTRSTLQFAAFVVLCGIPGTKGPNKFGDDPLS